MELHGIQSRSRIRSTIPRSTICATNQLVWGEHITDDQGHLQSTMLPQHSRTGRSSSMLNHRDI
eukprot:2269998-Amphidinium_carterae.1